MVVKLTKVNISIKLRSDLTNPTIKFWTVAVSTRSFLKTVLTHKLGQPARENRLGFFGDTPDNFAGRQDLVNETGVLSH